MRTYGSVPFRVVLVHGGPGAAGEMRPVAEHLAASFGVLEPYQTGVTIQGQVDELRYAIAQHTEDAVILVGYSWGAWLSCILAAQSPDLVRRLILISAGSFDEEYARGIDEMRMSRLSALEQEDVHRLVGLLKTGSEGERVKAFARIGELLGKADAFDLIDDDAKTECILRPDIFEQVWPEAAVLRASGELLTIAKSIRCPVVAIHGEHDCHAAAGVEKPLQRVVADFHFELLPRCGHTPWLERLARDRFFMILRRECLQGLAQQGY